MTNIGMKEYITYSIDEYVNKAVEFSKNLEALSKLKIITRNNFINSPICNYAEFTNEFEDKLIDIYKTHKW